MTFRRSLVRTAGAALAFAAFGSGCLLQSDGALMQADIQTLRGQLDAVKTGIDDDREALRGAIVRVEKKASELQEAIDALNSSARRTDADLGIQLDALQKTVQELTGRFEEVSFKLDRAQQAAAATPVGETKAEGKGPPGETAPPEPAEQKLALPADKKGAVDLVTKLLASKDAKQLADGRRLAADALNKWPKDEGVTDVLRLALGDRLVDEKQYQKAAVEYKKVLDAFPKGVRADAAMFKIAATFAAQPGYKEDAKVFFEELIKRYPKSGFAKEAKVRLSELDKKAPPKKK